MDYEYSDPTVGTGAVILYGGRDASTVYADTWAWNGSTWTNLGISTPGALRSTRMVWDAAQHELVMFGGSNSTSDSPATAQRKTWLFKQVSPGVFNWVDCACDNSIIALISPGLAYDAYAEPSGPSTDPTAGEVIEFGGNKGNTFSSNTYAFSGTGWTQLSPAAHPIPLSSPGMAFHTLKNQVILYGGKCNTGTGCSTGFYALTWGWNGSTWTQLSVGGPPGRTGHRLAYDPNLGTTSGLYTFGGQNQTGLLQDTWYLPPLGNWVQCSDTGLCLTKPSLRCCMGLAYDRRNAILTLFGGANCADADTVPCASYFGDTWTFDATGWHCVAGC